MNERYIELLSLYLDETLSKDEEEELFHLLSASDELKKDFLKHALLNEMMSQQFSEKRKDYNNILINNLNINIDKRVSNQQKSNKKWLISGLVFLLCILGILVWAWLKKEKRYMPLSEQKEFNFNFESNAYPHALEYGRIVNNAPIKPDSKYSLLAEEYDPDNALAGLTFVSEGNVLFDIDHNSYIEFKYWLTEKGENFSCWIDIMDSNQTYGYQIENPVFEKWTEVKIPFNKFSINGEYKKLLFDRKQRQFQVTWLAIAINHKPEIRLFIDDFKIFPQKINKK